MMKNKRLASILGKMLKRTKELPSSLLNAEIPIFVKSSLHGILAVIS